MGKSSVGRADGNCSRHEARCRVIAGESANGVLANTVYAYTPATNNWQTLTPLPANRFSGVGSMVDDKIYYTTGGSAVTYVGTPVD